MATAPLTALNSIKETLLGWIWPPAVSLARRTVLGIFSGLEAGSLLIIDEVSGAKHSFGKNPFDEEGLKGNAKSVYTVPNVEIFVKRDFFWLRLFLFADTGMYWGIALSSFWTVS